MESHFNNLSPAEAERLALLAEEMGETIQIIGKILRHGYDTSWTDLTNRQRLEMEIGDVNLIIGMMLRAGDVDRFAITRREVEKSQKIVPFLHHN